MLKRLDISSDKIVTVGDFQLLSWQIFRTKFVYGDNNSEDFLKCINHVFVNILKKGSDETLFNAIKYLESNLRKIGEIGKTARFSRQENKLKVTVMWSFIEEFRKYFKSETFNSGCLTADEKSDKIQAIFMFLFPVLHSSFYYWHSNWIEEDSLIVGKFRRAIIKLRNELIGAEVRNTMNMGIYGKSELPVYYL